MDRQPSLLSRLFFSLREKRLRVGWRLFGQLALMVFFLILLGIPVGVLLIAFPGISVESILILEGLVLFLSITLSVFVARRLLDRRTITSLGLQWSNRAVPDFVFGILLSGLMLGLVYLVEWAAGWLRFEGFAWQFDPWPAILRGMGGMFLAFLLVGWHEELISRGYWLQNISEGLDLWWGVAISSSLFALAHIANPNANIQAVLGLVAAGLFLALGYLFTRQLWLPIGLHIGWNFFEGPVFGFPVSGMEFYTLIRQQVEGPELLTGGAFGPEAGLVLLPILLLGSALIYLYSKYISSPT